jgi:hypothetical protein
VCVLCIDVRCALRGHIPVTTNQLRAISVLSNENATMTWGEEFFGAELVTKTGVKKTAEVLQGKEFVGLYFSAHWVSECCFACRLVKLIKCAHYVTTVPTMQGIHSCAWRVL